MKKYLFRSQRSYGLYILFEPAEDGACPYCVYVTELVNLWSNLYQFRSYHRELRKQTQIVANAYNRSIENRDPSDIRIFFVSVSPKAAPQIYQQVSINTVSDWIQSISVYN